MGSIFALTVTFSIRIYFIRILKQNLRNFKNKYKAGIFKRV